MPSIAQIKAGKQHPRPERPGLVKQAAIDTAKLGLRGLGAVGDVLERPSISLSEAYGDIVEGEEGGETTFDAWWRGLSEGRAGKKYQTFGERLVPEEEDEGFGRKALRIGAEIATDPTSYLGFGLLTSVGKRALMPVARGAKAIASSKLMQRVGHSAAGQQFARMVVPAMNHISYHGGKAGAKWTKSYEIAEREMRLAAEPMMKEFELAVKASGLGGRRYEDLRKSVRHVIEKTSDHSLPEGITREMVSDPRVQALGLKTEEMLRRMGATIEGFEDFKGDKIVLQMDDGSTMPFKVIEKYFPDMGNDVADTIASAGSKRAAENLAKKRGITVEQARELQRRYSGKAVRFGNIENPRTSRLALNLREDDVAKVLPRYIEQEARRLAFAKEFGTGLERSEDLMNLAEDFGLNVDTITDATNALRGVAPKSPFGMKGLAPYVMGFQVLTKMGPTSTISNISQQANIVVREGVSNYIRGLVKLARDDGVRTGSIEAVNAGMRASLAELIGKSTDTLPGRAAGKWLDISGFNLAEQANRRVGYAGGVASAEQAVKRGISKAGPGASPKDVLKHVEPGMSVKEGDVLLYQKTGKLTPGGERRVGIQAAEATQFTTNVMDLPIAWRSPEMKIAFQFKNFIYQQSRFLMRDVMGPAATWMETGGARGSIGPLTRALAMYPATGATVAAMREIYAEKTASLTGVKRRFGRKIDEDHPIWQMVQDSLYVGSLGMAGDMLEQAKRGNLMEWAAGPTGADIGVILGGLEKLLQGKELDPLAGATKFMPGRRAVPLAPTEVARRIEAIRSKLRRRSAGAAQISEKPRFP